MKIYTQNNGVVTKGDDWSKVAGQRLIVYRITYECAKAESEFLIVSDKNETKERYVKYHFHTLGSEALKLV